MKIALEIVFWLSAAALLYTYAGYPLLLFIVSTFRPLTVRASDYQPTVSFIITAYNEELDLAEQPADPGDRLAEVDLGLAGRVGQRDEDLAAEPPVPPDGVADDGVAALDHRSQGFAGNAQQAGGDAAL